MHWEGCGSMVSIGNRRSTGAGNTMRAFFFAWPSSRRESSVSRVAKQKLQKQQVRFFSFFSLSLSLSVSLFLSLLLCFFKFLRFFPRLLRILLRLFLRGSPVPLLPYSSLCCVGWLVLCRS